MEMELTEETVMIHEDVPIMEEGTHILGLPCQHNNVTNGTGEEENLGKGVDMRPECSPHPVKINVRGLGFFDVEQAPDLSKKEDEPPMEMINDKPVITPALTTTVANIENQIVKRRRGRPAKVKQPPTSKSDVKRKPGRPRIFPVKSGQVKRRPGRPGKINQLISTQQSFQEKSQDVKGRGRSRKVIHLRVIPGKQKNVKTVEPVQRNQGRPKFQIGSVGGQFVCDICSRELSSLGSLKTHKLIHQRNKKKIVQTGKSQKIRPFSCDECDRRFVQRVHLNQHIRSTHTGERPYQCTVCLKAFFQLGHLQQHYRLHTGEKPYKCPHCPMKFTQKNLLDVHVGRH